MVFCMLRIQTFDLCKPFKLNRDESKPLISVFSHLLPLQLGFSCLCFSLGLLKSGSMDIFMVPKNQQSFKCWKLEPNMKIYENILANLNGHKLSRSQFRRNKLFIYVIFFRQYEVWQQDGLINMEAGQTKLRFPKRSVVFQRLIFSSHLQLERCWILNSKAQDIKRIAWNSF